MRKYLFTQPISAVALFFFFVLASGKPALASSAEVPCMDVGEEISVCLDMNSWATTISKKEVRKKLKFLFTHNKVRNGLIEALHEHPKAALDFFFSYEGNAEKGMEKASMEFAKALAVPMAELLDVAKQQPENAKAAFVKGAGFLLTKEAFMRGFLDLFGIEQESSPEQCDLLKRNIDMKRKRAIDANMAWYLCAVENGTDSEACDMLWQAYVDAGNEWQDAVNDWLNAGCGDRQ